MSWGSRAPRTASKTGYNTTNVPSVRSTSAAPPSRGHVRIDAAGTNARRVARRLRAMLPPGSRTRSHRETMTVWTVSQTA